MSYFLNSLDKHIKVIAIRYVTRLRRNNIHWLFEKWYLGSIIDYVQFYAYYIQIFRLFPIRLFAL